MGAVKKHQIEYLPPGDLTEFSGNPKAHPEAQLLALERSIEEFGFNVPVLVDAKLGLIAGHGRVLAAKRAGLDLIPVIRVAHLTEEQKRAFVLADNKLAELGSWDERLLAEQLQAILESGGDLSVTGFGLDEARELIGALGATSGLTDPNDAPPLEEVAVTQPGDIWTLGRHRIVCGSATDADTVSALLRGERPHLMVTDPPYGVNYDASWRAKVNKGGDLAVGKVINDHQADWREAWALFQGDVAYVWHAGTNAHLVAESLLACRFEIRAQIVWVKTRRVFSRGDYHWQHEPCYVVERRDEDGDADELGSQAESWEDVFTHELSTYSVKKGKTGHWRGDRKQSTVWQISHTKSDTGHSTQKPIECMLRPVENNSAPGDVVYEPFSGSGTTIIACEMSGRPCRAVELSPHYVDVAVRRWQAFTGKHAISANGAAFPS